jgi:hypothetical protein
VGNQSRIQRTSTNQAQSETIDCQRRDILLYSVLKECRALLGTNHGTKGRLTLQPCGTEGQG